MLTPLRVFTVLAPVCFCFTTLDFFSLSYQSNILWFSLISSHVMKKRLKPRETKTNVTFVTDHIDIICALFSSCLTFSYPERKLSTRGYCLILHQILGDKITGDISKTVGRVDIQILRVRRLTDLTDRK